MANEAAVTKAQQPESQRPFKPSRERPSAKAFLKTHDEGQMRPPAVAQRAVAPVILPAVTIIKPSPPPAPPPLPILREIAQRRQAEKPVEEYGRDPDIGPDIGQAIQQRRGQGGPLPEDVQTQLETGLQAPLGDVRLHTDGAADQLSRAVQAKAFTTGNDIFFRQGQYNPGSQNGLHLLAHESAHVVQQRQGPVSGTAAVNGVVVSEPGDPFEREAESAADLAIQRIAAETPEQSAPLEKRTAVASSAAPAVIQREGDGQEILDLEWIVPQSNDRAALLADCRALSNDMLLKKEFAEQVVYAIVTDKLYFYAGSASAPSASFQLKKGGFTFGSGYYLDKPGQTYWKALALHQGKRGFYKFTYGANTDRHQMVNWLADGEYARIQAKLSEVSAIGIFMAIGSGGKGEGEAGEGETAAPPVPNWLIQLRKNVETLVSQEREKQPKPLDLPSRLTVWYGRKDSQWYMNVFVHFDAQGKEKRHKSLVMQQGEKPDELLRRIRAAVTQILQQEKEQSASKGAAVPPWAKLLKDQLSAALKSLRKAEPDATDFPDRLALTVVKNGGEKPVDEIHLQLWLDITREGKKETVGATAGWPLRQGMDAKTLASPVRQLAAAIRADKAKLGGRPAPPAETTPETGGKQTANLPAYPAVIEPLDFRPDLVTVDGAENSLRIKLNYAAVHGSRDIDVVPAMMQLVYYNWQIYNVSRAVTPEQQAANAKAKNGMAPSESWPVRRERLQREAESGNLAKGSPLVSETEYSPDKKIKLPVGIYADYLIQANATPKANGANQRATSRAYLVIRASSAATLGAEMVDSAVKQVDALKWQLQDQSLSPAERRKLQNRLDDLENEEKLLLPGVSRNKLHEIEKIIIQLDQLDKAIKADKSGGGNAEQDPLMLRLSPELGKLWVQTVAAGESIPQLKKRFEAQKIQLQQLLKRSELFADKLKPGSMFQFRPIVTLISKVTGQSYPLLMTLGEAPDSTPSQRKYNLIDLTSSQTQKVYGGSSSKEGDAGHNEAIAEAFRAFGRQNQYGEGKIALRIPQRFSFGFHPKVPQFYESAPGPWEIAVKWLGYAAAAAGIAALILGVVATGGALGVAATAVGTFSAVVGAGLAVHNMSERQAAHRLKWDAETMLDVISIIGAATAVTGAARAAGQVSRLARRPAWIQGFERIDKVLYIHGAAELGASTVLTAAKVVDDIERIQNDPELTPEQKEKMIAQIVVDAVKSGGMLAVSAGRLATQADPFAHSSNSYKSMVDKGWIDPKTKQWTDAAPPTLRGASSDAPAAKQLPAAKPEDAPAAKPQPKPEDAPAVTPQPKPEETAAAQQPKPENTPAAQQPKPEDTPAAKQPKPEDAPTAAKKKPLDDPEAKQNQPPVDATVDEVAQKLKQQREQIEGEQKPQPPVKKGKPAKAPTQPAPPEFSPEDNARKKIQTTKDFNKLRQEAAKGKLSPEETAILQQQREALIVEAQQAVTPAIEAKHGVTIEYKNLGTPGFQSDMDITAVASCGKRLKLRKQGVPEAEIVKKLSPKDIKREIAASVEASNQMYAKLRKGGLEPDKALDANFYTELRVNDLMSHAKIADKRQIALHDQDVVSLAELRRGMPPAEWQKFKKERLKSLKSLAEEYEGRDILGETKRKFAAAEKMEADVKKATLEDLQKQLSDTLQNPDATIPEIREAMARLKLKEPDAYGAHAAYSDVVGSQQKGASDHRELQKLREKAARGEALSPQEASQLAAGNTGGMDAFLARAGGEKRHSAEHFHFLGQSATASAGKLHEHTKASGNSEKDVRDAAKYLSRAQYAANEAETSVDGMMRGRDLTQIIAAKSSGDPAAATMKALENWALNSGHGELIGKPAALRDKFVSEARKASLEISHELGYMATAAKSYRPEKGKIADAEPQTPLERTAMEAARAGQGRQIMADKTLNDVGRLESLYGPGEWIKMEYVAKRPASEAGGAAAKPETAVNIHWFHNKTTGQNVEFKFKQRDF
jgi:hypothetical protein